MRLLILWKGMVELEKRKIFDDRNGEVAIFFDRTDEKLRKNRREHERSVVLQCFQQLLGTNNLELCHADSGAPYLSSHSEYEISVSHSKNWYAVQLSKSKNVGIDIQVFRKDGLQKGYSYFVNDREEKSIELSDENLHLIWSAKEAVYKYKKGKIELYKESITVTNICDNTLSVEVESDDLECFFEMTENYTLVYVL